MPAPEYWYRAPHASGLTSLPLGAAFGRDIAADYLRSLYRDGRLTAIELNKQLRALNDVAAGKLRPVLSNPANTGTRKHGK